MTQLFPGFAGGTITNSPLTAGGTSITSAAFEFLPVVASPHFIKLVLDPEGDDGTPEIVYITAHSSASTTCTATRGQETAYGGSVGREHVATTPWVVAFTALDARRSNGDPGDVKWGCWASAPDGWLLFGQTIVNAQTTYVDLWAVVPAAWKSGSSLVLPSVDAKTFLGGGTLGASGGANTHTLIEANLPAHTHTIDHNHDAVTSASGGVAHTHDIDHNHASVTSGAASATAHTHDIDHNHGAVTSASGGGHSHDVAVRESSTAGTTGSAMAASATGASTTTTTGIEAAHTHSVDLSNFTGTSGSGGVAHTHAVDLPDFSGTSGAASATSHDHIVNLPNFTGSSGSIGSGTAVDHTPSHLRLNCAIKT